MNHSTNPSEPTPLHLVMIASAGRALGVPLRFDSVIVDYEDSPSIIVRCRTHPDSGPETVAVKRPRKRSGVLFHEWGSLDFLNQLPETGMFVPTLLAVNAEDEISVMEDLGESDHQQLGRILEGGDPELAGDALAAFMEALARVQGVAAGREDEFRSSRAGYPEAGVSRHRVHQIVEALKLLPEHLDSMGVVLNETARAEILRAQEELVNPGPFHTWSHGDWTPANAFYDPARSGTAIRFFDLESSGWRHALLDGVYPRLRYIHSVWARRIPRDLQLNLDSLYRKELARHIPEAAEDTLYSMARLAAATGWLAGLLSFLPEVLKEDRRWGRSTRRQRIVAALEHLGVLSSESDTFPAMGQASRDAVATLRDIWPEPDCIFPMHQAFTTQA